ncbi:MAG: hypothetical protein ACYSU5_09775 [Planctomycetota bacterium]|jgi:hypothetical protein
MKIAWYFLLAVVSTVTIGCDTESGPNEAASPELQPTAVEKQELPYEIAGRPIPTGDQADTLLPLQVGSFRRQSVRTPQDIHKGSFYATYSRYRSTVNVELSICATASDSQMAIGRAKAETDAEFPDANQLFVKWQEMTCLRTVCVHGLDAGTILLLRPCKRWGERFGRDDGSVSILTDYKLI